MLVKVSRWGRILQEVSLLGSAHERSEGPFDFGLLLVDGAEDDLVKTELKARSDFLQDDLSASLLKHVVSMDETGVCKGLISKTKNEKRKKTNLKEIQSSWLTKVTVRVLSLLGTGKRYLRADMVCVEEVFFFFFFSRVVRKTRKRTKDGERKTNALSEFGGKVLKDEVRVLEGHGFDVFDVVSQDAVADPKVHRRSERKMRDDHAIYKEACLAPRWSEKGDQGNRDEKEEKGR